MNDITVEIVKLVNGGQGLGFYDGKPVFAWNVLPGETAVIRLTKTTEKYFEGVAVRLTNPSPERVDPIEDHFMSCSPWQIMTFAYENRWKREIAKETFKRLGGVDLPGLEIIHDRRVFGYRNKIEYRFCAGSDSPISLAFHKRGATDLLPIDKCFLAKDNINKAAVEIIAWLNRSKVAAQNLNGLLLRENNGGLVVALLTVTDKNFQLPAGAPGEDILSGFHLYFSDPLNRGHVRLKLMSSLGRDYITEEIAGKTFKCGPLSFFQVNTAVFAKTLSRIREFVGTEDDIVDFYSGVGAIGISLSDKIKAGILVEMNPEASALAADNIIINDLKNVTARSGSAESLLNEIKRDRTIIFDPPRAGLDQKVIGRLLEILPRKIIYLSCDAATQARDLKMVGQEYEVVFSELYNFFPRTPHIESLLVLERK